MGLKIRLMRTGKPRQPSYRVVVKETRSPRQGTYLEWVGEFNPRTDPETVELNEERIRHWLSVGARPTDTVRRLINKYTSLELKTRAISQPTKPKEGE
jgi:small subunit ribosomal protein S16